MINIPEAVTIGVLFIIGTIAFTKKLGQEWAWINRKLIHLSVVPAILMFYWGLIPRWIFSGAAFLIGLIQLWPHLRRRELSWYQLEHNYGEVFFALSASVISATLPIEYATALLLAMAISDGVTGIIRHYYFKRHGFNVKLKKHWTGSLGYFVTAVIIAFIFLNAGTVEKIGWAAMLTLAEYQRLLDDNLAVPLVGGLLYPLY
ncbi:diacylglycerol/polyprenol kinase family protein [Thermococcus gorgonarius]|uniref:Phosphatidate cytidylyltransferase n=1 Tax=Thermococcus gorgonarius TaxID=71997 RepID=A0A2Z2M4V0_THEGO|nr:hypothetical protein [Thermococcus gorgonarius]ASJ00053.1 hypothetical protein A3K92_00420 [Thermococcus gorgonarius]